MTKAKFRLMSKGDHNRRFVPEGYSRIDIDGDEYHAYPQNQYQGNAPSRSTSWRTGSPFRPSKSKSLRVRFPRIKRYVRNLLCGHTALIFLLGVISWLFLYEPHIEIVVYSRRWIQREILPIPPLAGCFDQANDETYNITELVWQRKTTWEVQSGVDMKQGMLCYDFSGMVGKGASYDERERKTFHTYWRTDLAPFGPRQENMLKSFFATQPLRISHLILWSNGELSRDPIIQRYLTEFPESFSVRVADMQTLARGTALNSSEKLAINDKKAWVDGDLLRLLLLWNHGGVWVDMDSLLTRDLHPLLEHEFVTQWDCYNKPYTPLNGALMHFHAHSPYLCEAFHIMESEHPPRPGTTDWGSLLYTKLWRRLVHAGVPPFKVLPWCFSDGRSCRIDNRLPDPFKNDGEGQGRWVPGDAAMSTREGGLLDQVLHKVFSVHLHNQWDKDFPEGGWVQRLLLDRYDAALKDRAQS